MDISVKFAGIDDQYRQDITCEFSVNVSHASFRHAFEVMETAVGGLIPFMRDWTIQYSISITEKNIVFYFS